MPVKWSVQGTLLEAGSCRGSCQGTPLWHIEDGQCRDLPLAGLNQALNQDRRKQVRGAMDQLYKYAEHSKFSYSGEAAL